MVIACTRDCYDTCIFEPLKTSDGLAGLRPLRIFPIDGFTCARGATDVKRLSAGDRLLRPLVRRGGRAVEEEWGRAESMVAEEIRETLRNYGPEAILHVNYDGNQGLLTWDYPQRLWNAMGASSTDYSICSTEGREALRLHYGSPRGALPGDLAGAKAVVFWGVNAASSFIHGFVMARRMRKKIVAVDVVETETVRSADLAVVLRPGTDAALALGVANILIQRGLVDMEFIERNTLGFEEYARHVERFTPDYVERVSGVERGVVEELAETYHRERPVTVIGFAMGRALNGGEAVRAISLIPALLGMHRGFFYSNSSALGIDHGYLKGLHIGGPARTVGMGLIGDEVERRGVRLIFVWNSNPLITLPGWDKVKRAVEAGEVFLVVHDPFLTETARIANVALPAPTYLEKDDIAYSYWHDVLVYNSRAAEPPGEARSELWLMHRLAHLLGLGDNPLMKEDPWLALDRALRGTGVSVEELRRNGYAKARTKPKDTYETPSGRIEFTSRLAASKGLPPMPIFQENSAGMTLVFTSNKYYTNSQFRNVFGEPAPAIHVSREDAAGLGLVEGCVVEAMTRYGSFRAVARIGREARRGVAFMDSFYHDLRGEPINYSTERRPARYGGTPLINATEILSIKRL